VAINVSDTNQNFSLIVGGTRTINNYNYLGYVGTNFDLVDGVKAQNLFFAVNLFAPPQLKGDGFGFNLTLYGNRSLTATDTSGRVNIPSKVVGLGGDSARYYREEALKTVSRVSDNLGATFSPLIRLGRMSDHDRKTQVLYAPQLEFIWRRTKVTTKYSDNILIDSGRVIQGRPITGTIILTPPNEIVPINIYDFYLGALGLVLNHENNFISVRLQGSIGVNYRYASDSKKYNSSNNLPSYTRSVNIQSYVRAWITEPTSGLTFGAEVSNTIGKLDNYQPYYNVTLSKAFNLNALGAIFNPVISRK